MCNEEEILKSAGIRPTAIRLLIFREIVRIDRTFNLSEMEERLDTVDKSTLFRTLTLFQQHHILHEVDNGSGSKLYCLCTCGSSHHTSHIHFTCTRCGKVEDVEDLSLPENLSLQAEERLQCQVENLQLTLWGICCDCLRQEAH